MSPGRKIRTGRKPAIKTKSKHKMVREIAKPNARHKFFTNRTVDNWDRPDCQTFNPKSVASFKRLLDAEMAKIGNSDRAGRTLSHYLALIKSIKRSI